MRYLKTRKPFALTMLALLTMTLLTTPYARAQKCLTETEAGALAKYKVRCDETELNLKTTTDALSACQNQPCDETGWYQEPIVIILFTGIGMLLGAGLVGATKK